jgi:hypothetical protein
MTNANFQPSPALPDALMMPADLMEMLVDPRTDKRRLAHRIVAHPELVTTLIPSLGHAQARVRFTAARVLEFVAEQSPALLYPQFDFFVRLLDHPNSILQWESIRILARLVAVDSEHRFDRLFRRFFAPIRGPVMITAGNLIANAVVIARARPEWADRIARKILEVEKARYQTDECRNVAMGHAIQALTACRPLLKKPGPALAFIRRQTQNSRPSTRGKALAALIQWEPSPIRI